MKTLHIKREFTRSSNIPANILIGCLQILAGNDQSAIECKRPSEAIKGLEICEHLKEYKIASFKEKFEWKSIEFIHLIDRSHCEQALLEEGEETRDMERFQWDMYEILPIRMKQLKLKIVGREDNEDFGKIGRRIYESYRIHLMRHNELHKDIFYLSGLERYLSNPPKSLSFAELYLRYCLQFLRKRSSEESKKTTRASEALVPSALRDRGIGYESRHMPSGLPERT